jgi:hypothetical protein
LTQNGRLIGNFLQFLKRGESGPWCEDNDNRADLYVAVEVNNVLVGHANAARRYGSANIFWRRVFAIVPFLLEVLVFFVVFETVLLRDVFAINAVAPKKSKSVMSEARVRKPIPKAPESFSQKVAAAFHTIVATPSDAEQLHRKLDPGVSREPE